MTSTAGDGRLVPLAGAANVRDLGGYATEDGGRVRTGVLYRGDALSRLTDADVARLTGLGITLVVDHRSFDEVVAEPGRLGPGQGVRVEHVPIEDRMVQERNPVQLILAGELRRYTEDDFGAVYVRMATAAADRFGRAVSLLASADGAALFHCTAGKDRTGVTAALVLSAVGVPTEVVLDDYELTDRYRTGDRLAALAPRLAEVGVAIEDVAALFSARRHVLATLLEHLAAEPGGILGYLTGPAGVPAGAVEALRVRLVEPTRGTLTERS